MSKSIKCKYIHTLVSFEIVYIFHLLLKISMKGEGQEENHPNISCDCIPINMLPGFSEALGCSITGNMLRGNDNSWWKPSFPPSQGHPLTPNMFPFTFIQVSIRSGSVYSATAEFRPPPKWKTQQQSQDGIWSEHARQNEPETLSTGQRRERMPPHP